MREVTREDYHAFIQRYPERLSYRTGICDPPQEHCVNDGVLIGRIRYGYYDLKPECYEVAAEGPEVTA